MIRKLLVGVAIAGLMGLGTALSVHSVQAQSQPDRSDKQEQKATKSISGKVTNIANGGHSFTLEVAGSNNKSMDFVVDKNTQVNGQVKQGTDVTVAPLTTRHKELFNKVHGRYAKLTRD